MNYTVTKYKHELFNVPIARLMSTYIHNCFISKDFQENCEPLPQIFKKSGGIDISIRRVQMQAFDPSWHLIHAKSTFDDQHQIFTGVKVVCTFT